LAHRISFLPETESFLWCGTKSLKKYFWIKMADFWGSWWCGKLF